VGISDWFRPRTASSRPDDLRAALLDAFGRKDYDRAMQLINDNSDRIKREFRSWTTVPEQLRGDAEAVSGYANMLMAIARIFEKSGDASLRTWFEAGGGDNPVTRWQDAVRAARGLIEGGQTGDAIVLMRATLDDIATASGTAVARYRAVCLGTIGTALHKQGDTAEAVRVTGEALEICRDAGDEEGVRAYTNNLDVIGSGQVADAGAGDRFSVVFRDRNGRTLLPEELAAATGPFTWEIRGTGTVPSEARRLHEEGRATGGSGKHDEAIALFTRAADLDPSWPHPVYDRAYAHLLKQDFAAALADYRKTLELAPRGFFTAATSADMLAREAAGEFPPGLHAAFVMLEDMPDDLQRQIVRQIVERHPSHAPAWQLHARLLAAPAEKLAAIERGLLARPDPDTRGALLVEKAQALHQSGERQAAFEILDTLASAVGDSLNAYAAACIARALIRSGEPAATP
jgi:tetratricopeptide (TPR) repeat protein